mgnify:CR=1 FL=1
MTDNIAKGSNGTAPNARPIWCRREDVPDLLPISLRTVGNWQQRRLIPFYRVSERCVMFKLTDLEAALERFRVAPISEPQTRTPRRRAGRIGEVKPSTAAQL